MIAEVAKNDTERHFTFSPFLECKLKLILLTNIACFRQSDQRVILFDDYIEQVSL